MKLQILSDLHLEFHPDHGEGFLSRLDVSGADALIIAGDLATAPLLAQSLAALARRCPLPLLFVPGNHDHYGSELGKVEQELRDLQAGLPNLRVLLNQSAEIKGRRFLGGTLWFPFKEEARKFEGAIMDFTKIRHFRQDAYARHKTMLELLQRELRSGDVVISHHLPSRLSVAGRYQGSPYNAFYANDLDALIRERRPALWVHGHTHDHMDYRLGDTRVVCNPYGYHEAEVNAGFRERWVLEI